MTTEAELADFEAELAQLDSESKPAEATKLAQVAAPALAPAGGGAESSETKASQPVTGSGASGPAGSDTRPAATGAGVPGMTVKPSAPAPAPGGAGARPMVGMVSSSGLGTKRAYDDGPGAPTSSAGAASGAVYQGPRPVSYPAGSAAAAAAAAGGYYGPVPGMVFVPYGAVPQAGGYPPPGPPPAPHAMGGAGSAHPLPPPPFLAGGGGGAGAASVPPPPPATGGGGSRLSGAIARARAARGAGSDDEEEGPGQEGKESDKGKGHVRSAAGKVWNDHTLDDWPGMHACASQGARGLCLPS